MGPYRPLMELALSFTTPSQSEIGRSVGLGIISTLCQEVSILVISELVPGLTELHMYVLWMDCDRRIGSLSSPDDDYFEYDPRPMSDQRSDKKAIPGNICFFLFSSETRA